MDDSSPYSALIAVADHRFITGDDEGLIKVCCGANLSIALRCGMTDKREGIVSP